jgi:predicted alpha/beta-fold hydrolase
LTEWESGRRVYNLIITENVKRLLLRNYEKAVEPHVQSNLIDKERLFESTLIVGVDEAYNKRVQVTTQNYFTTNQPLQGFNTIHDMYHHCSSINRIPDIKIPMVFLNSADDPLFPERAFNPVQQICAKHKRHAFIRLK